MIGLDVLETLQQRGSAHLSDMRIIILSGCERTDRLQNVWKLGADSYWVKPLTADQCRSLAPSVASSRERDAVRTGTVAGTGTGDASLSSEHCLLPQNK